MIKQTLLLFILICFFSCKEQKKTKHTLSKYETIDNRQFINENWDLKHEKNNESFFKKGNISLKIISGVDNMKNIEKKEVYINNLKIFTHFSNTWIYTPFLYSYKNKYIILIESGDEGGSWGHDIFYVVNNKASYCGMLEIFPKSMERLTTDKDFLRIVDNNEKINFEILDQFFLFGNDYIEVTKEEIKNFILKKESKIITEILPNANSKELMSYKRKEKEYSKRIQQWHGSYNFEFFAREGEDGKVAIKIDAIKSNGQIIFDGNITEASIVRATKDTLELKSIENRQYIIYKSNEENGKTSYAITGHDVYMLNPPNDHYSLIKQN